MTAHKFCLTVDLRHELPCWNAAQRHIESLQQLGWQIQWVRNDIDRQEMLTQGCDAFWGWNISSAECLSCPGLRWVSTPAAGSDYWDEKLLKESRLILTTSHGFHGIAMAEHAFAMLISLARGLHRSREMAQSMPWDEWRRWMEEQVISLHGANLALMGIGGIGLHMAKIALSFGMKLRLLGKTPRWHDTLQLPVYGIEHWNQELQACRFIINSLPSNLPNTAKMNDQRLENLPEPTVLINIGRGVSLDEEAILRRVRRGVLRVGLDVFASEPLSMNHPLRAEEQVMLSPHASAICPEYLDRALNVQILQMKKFEKNELLEFQEGG